MHNVTQGRFRATTVAVEIGVTHYECVFVALGIQHALRVRDFVICGLLGSTIFFHNISQTARLKKRVTEPKMCFYLLNNFF